MGRTKRKSVYKYSEGVGTHKDSMRRKRAFGVRVLIHATERIIFSIMNIRFNPNIYS